MSKKMMWCKAQDAGQYFGLDAEEVADLVLVMEGYQAFFEELDLKYALRIVMRSGSGYEFFIGKPTDVEHGATRIEIHKAAGEDEHYEVLEFDINVESFALHKLSKSEDFPHNLITFLAHDVNDHYLASEDSTESEREFARKVYDLLIAVAEKRIFEKKFSTWA